MSRKNKRRERGEQGEQGVEYSGRTVQVHLVLTNKRALHALTVIVNAIAEMAEGREWDPEAQRTLRAARYAYNHLGIVEYEDPDPDR